MANYFGNSIPAPGTHEGTPAKGNFELLYSTVGYVQKGVTMEPGKGVVEAGTFLVQDATTKRYRAYDPDEVDGPAIRGVLRQTLDTGTDANGQVWQANILYSAVVKLAPMLKANGLTAGSELVTAFQGRADEAAGFYKF